MKPEPGLLIGDKVRLERQLARGGMGSVWEAHHERLDSRVAVKFMDGRLADSADARARFEREAKAAARLRSPHVVQVFDYGVVEDTPYIVMELLEGEDLRTRLKRRGRLSLAETASIIRQVCKALRLAADAGIVHRDLKPGNIFLARSSDDEVVKVLDFGVAKMTRTTIKEGTASGQLLGSPHYMSPEQARGGSLDTRSDLFSLASIAFEMATGRRLFEGTDVGDVIVRICVEPLPKVTEVCPELPPELDQYFERALARDRAQRFQSPQAMAAELGAIASRHLGLSTPVSSGSGPIVAATSDSDSYGPALAAQALADARASALAPLPVAESTSGGTPLAPAPHLQAGDDDTQRSARAPELGLGDTERALASSAALPEAGQRSGARRRVMLGGLALGLVGGVIGFLVMRPPRSEGPEAGSSAAAAAESQPSAATSSALDTPGGDRAGAAATAGSATSSVAGPSAATKPSASAAKSPSVPTTAHTKPPASSRPAPSSTTSKHPVLGI